MRRVGGAGGGATITVSGVLAEARWLTKQDEVEERLGTVTRASEGRGGGGRVVGQGKERAYAERQSS